MSRDILYIYISWMFLFFGFICSISLSAWMKKRNWLALHGIPPKFMLLPLDPKTNGKMKVLGPQNMGPGYNP